MTSNKALRYSLWGALLLCFIVTHETVARRGIIVNVKNLSLQRKVTIDNWRLKQQSLMRQYPRDLILHGAAAGRMVALTFDDGPDQVITPLILDLLSSHNVKATFFFLGSKIKKYPEVVRRAHREGHLVLNHSYDHPQFTKISNHQIIEQLIKTEKMLDDLIGRRPKFCRPPYGDIDLRVIKTLKNLGYTIILWSLDTIDWAKQSKHDVASFVAEFVRPGDIILMHSASRHQNTAAALPDILDHLHTHTYTCVRVDQLIT